MHTHCLYTCFTQEIRERVKLLELRKRQFAWMTLLALGQVMVRGEGFGFKGEVWDGVHSYLHPP